MIHSQKNYIAVIILKESRSDYGAHFPDFPGCISAGKTLEEVKKMGEEALQFHVDGMMKDGEELPRASTLDKIKSKYKKAVIFLIVPVRVKTKASRINITIDEKLLRKLDRYLADHYGENRSAFFAKAIEKACH